MRTNRRASLTLLIGTAAACGGGTEPKPLTGVYSLTSVDGQPLPAPYGCGAIIRSGHLELSADSAALTYTSGEGADAYTGESRGSYVSASGGKLVISYAPFRDTHDTVSVLGGGRLMDRAWLPVNAACTGTAGVQTNLGFTHD